MKKLIKYFILCILLVSFYTSFKTFQVIDSFNTENVINTIDYLCSDHFKGRLSGTLENKQVEQYIKLKFIENNLKPFMGSYEQTFKINYPKMLNKEPFLNIIDTNGHIVKNFIYNKDFKEDMLNFRNNKFSINNENPLLIQRKTSIQIKQNKDYFLFYIPSDRTLEFRSSFIKTAPWSMCIKVTENTLKTIKEALSKNFTINCFIPFTTQETTARNIMGYIEGKDKDSDPIIISAHFDHLGCDLCNNIYKGALDNASGTAFMMEMIKYINSIGKPTRNILFLGFNAEEFGCIGSTNFVQKYKNHLKNSKVFNFDMIGSDNGVPLYIMGGKKDSSKNDFINSISSTCIDEDIHFNYLFKDASDHKSFRENNIDAITLCDNDTSRIHTPNDKPEFISTTAIERCFNVASKEIIKQAYYSNPMLIYYKQCMIISLTGIILILIHCIKNKRAS
ncbi:M28 family metallopeptidase [Clostridium aestuarii]|uniref:M28 family metallopeptidase n=1 Tax=Clostridium aestuarii TaxID=338193 RepID=A0ABT4D339_9CLOT|nr:M28 family metallopeptidase [Clostridium aestuarii]MCY6485653.1 M28 family metallopeptidase [Clostridium aestuarii]